MKPLQAKIKDAEKRNEVIHREEFLVWLAIQITRDWGAPCDEESKGCPCCSSWAYFEKLKKL
jgi:hypothetical protein